MISIWLLAVIFIGMFVRSSQVHLLGVKMLTDVEIASLSLAEQEDFLSSLSLDRQIEIANFQNVVERTFDYDDFEPDGWDCD